MNFVNEFKTLRSTVLHHITTSLIFIRAEQQIRFKEPVTYHNNLIKGVSGYGDVEIWDENNNRVDVSLHDIDVSTLCYIADYMMNPHNIIIEPQSKQYDRTRKNSFI
jgi:hypothetical protein